MGTDALVAIQSLTILAPGVTVLLLWHWRNP
jgi:hypothetical protein